jgi:arylsulfatase A-like enzyme
LKEGVIYNYGKSLMEPSRLNIASYLKQHGYNTAMVGKWHLGLDWSDKSKPGEITGKESDVDFTKPFRNGPVDMGFDTFFGIGASLDMPPYVYLENNKPTTIPTVSSTKFGRRGLADKELNPSDFLPAFTKRAVSYIETQDPR